MIWRRKKQGYVVILRERGGIGDILCTLPVCRAYKQQGYHIIYITDVKYHSFLSFCPYIDTLIHPDYLPERSMHSPVVRGVFPKHERGDRTWLDGIFVRHLDMERAPDNVKVINLFGCAYALEHTCLMWGFQPSLNRVEIFWTAAGFDLTTLPKNPLQGVLKPPSVEYLPKEVATGTPYCVIQAHSTDPFRHYPIEQLVNDYALGYRKGEWAFPVIVGTQAGYIQQLVRRLGTGLALINIPLPALFALVRYATHVFCPDSALLHIAETMGVECTAYFSTTNGHLITRRYEWVNPVQTNCTPCYQHRDWIKEECLKANRCLALEGE